MNKKFRIAIFLFVLFFSFFLSSLIFSDLKPTNAQTLVNESNVANTVVIDYDVGYTHVIALDEYGDVWTWGNGDFGRLGHGAAGYKNVPTKVKLSSDESLPKMKKVAAGRYSSYAIDLQGNLWAWGYGIYNALGNSFTGYQYWPTQITFGGEIKFTSITADESYALGIDEEKNVWAWGYNYYGQLGLGNTSNQSVPVKLTGISDIEHIEAGGFSVTAVNSSKELFCWGNNLEYMLGIEGTTGNISVPQKIFIDSQQTQLPPIKQSSIGLYGGIAVGLDGSAWVWGRNLNYELAQGNTTSYYGKLLNPKNSGNGTLPVLVNCAKGFYKNAAIDIDGNIWVWGNSETYSLGLNTVTTVTSPTKIEEVYPLNEINNESNRIAPPKFVDVKLPQNGSAATFGVALDVNGQLWSWGNNAFGQVGINSTTNIRRPIPVIFPKTSRENISIEKTPEETIISPATVAININMDLSLPWRVESVKYLENNILLNSESDFDEAYLEAEIKGEMETVIEKEKYSANVSENGIYIVKVVLKNGMDEPRVVLLDIGVTNIADRVSVYIVGYEVDKNGNLLNEKGEIVQNEEDAMQLYKLLVEGDYITGYTIDVVGWALNPWYEHNDQAFDNGGINREVLVEAVLGSPQYVNYYYNKNLDYWQNVEIIAYALTESGIYEEIPQNHYQKQFELAKKGLTFTKDAPSIDGYSLNLNHPETISLIRSVSIENYTLKFYYEPILSTIVVNYKYGDDLGIHTLTSYNKQALFGREFTVYADELFNDYVFDSAKTLEQDSSIEVNERKKTFNSLLTYQEVIFWYKKADAKVLIETYFYDGTDITAIPDAFAEILDLEIGTVYRVYAPAIDGYALNDPNNMFQDITIVAGTNIAVFYYVEYVSGVVLVKLFEDGIFIENFIVEDGGHLDTNAGNGIVSVQAPDLSGLYLILSQEEEQIKSCVISGTEENDIIIFEYTRLLRKVKVQAIDENGQPIEDFDKGYQPVGKEYSLTAPMILGYKLMGTTADVSVEIPMGESDFIIELTYKKIWVITIMAKNYSDDSTIYQTSVIADLKEEVFIEAPSLLNRILVGNNITQNNDNSIFIVVDSYDIAVTFYYKSDINGNSIPDDEEQIKITEKFQDANEDLEDINEKTLEFGSDYNMTAPSIEGYTFIGWKLDSENTIRTGIKEVIILNLIEDHTVTFVYEKINRQVTEKYQDEFGAELFSDTEVLIESSGTYTRQPPQISGWTYLGYKLNGGELVTGSIDITNITSDTEIIYVFQINNKIVFYKVTEKYVNEVGEKLLDDIQILIRENEAYSKTPIIFGWLYVGYKINGGEVVEGIINLDNIQADITVWFVFQSDFNNEGIPDAEKTFKIIQYYYDKDGNEIKGITENSISFGNKFIFSDSELEKNGWVLVGYEIDGEWFSGNSIVLLNIKQDYQIKLVYEKQGEVLEPLWGKLLPFIIITAVVSILILVIITGARKKFHKK